MKIKLTNDYILEHYSHSLRSSAAALISTGFYRDELPPEYSGDNPAIENLAISNVVYTADLFAKEQIKKLKEFAKKE